MVDYHTVRVSNRTLASINESISDKPHTPKFSSTRIEQGCYYGHAIRYRWTMGMDLATYVVDVKSNSIDTYFLNSEGHKVPQFQQFNISLSEPLVEILLNEIKEGWLVKGTRDNLKKPPKIMYLSDISDNMVFKPTAKRYSTNGIAIELCAELYLIKAEPMVEVKDTRSVMIPDVEAFLEYVTPKLIKECTRAIAQREANIGEDRLATQEEPLYETCFGVILQQALDIYAQSLLPLGAIVEAPEAEQELGAPLDADLTSKPKSNVISLDMREISDRMVDFLKMYNPNIGPENITLRILAEFCYVLDLKPNFELRPKDDG